MVLEVPASWWFHLGFCELSRSLFFFYIALWSSGIIDSGHQAVAPTQPRAHREATEIPLYVEWSSMDDDEGC